MLLLLFVGDKGWGDEEFDDDNDDELSVSCATVSSFCDVGELCKCDGPGCGECYGVWRDNRLLRRFLNGKWLSIIN